MRGIEIIFQIAKSQKMSEEVENHVLARYSLIKKVGSGAYGIVWKVTDRKTGETLALKKIFDAFQHSIDAQRTYREICYLHQMSHGNIIKLQNVIRADNDKDLYLVFEFMEADLHNAIGQKILKDLHNRYILYQLLKGIKYLHSAEIIHRDLKPSNLLINSDCSLKICDFGLARSLANDEKEADVVLTEEVATRWYRAPEVLLGSQTYGKSADIWSVGCILGQLLVGKPLFPGNSTLNQIERILTFVSRPSKEDIYALNASSAEHTIGEVKGVKPKPINEWFRPDIPAEAKDLIIKMLQFNPEKRITISEALKHPYLQQFHNPREQTVSNKVIQPPISDNKKLNLKQYKQLIYERLKKIYSGSSPTSTSECKKTASSIHRASDISREKQYESPLRQSYNSYKSTKVSSSQNKYSSTVPYNNYSSYSSVNSTVLNDEEKEKMRKKASLKEILKNKREKSAGLRNDKSQSKFDSYSRYDSHHHLYKDYNKSSTTSPIMKYYKPSTTGSMFKENRGPIKY